MKTITPKQITVALFAVLLLLLAILQVTKSDKAVSEAERRPLAEKPTLSFESVTKGDYFEDYETYLLDQAIFRDAFRSIKAISSRYFFLRGDNNGLYLKNRHLFKIEEMKEESFVKAGEKIEALSEKLSALNCYYTMIPDKQSLSGGVRPSIDLEKAEAVLAETVKGAEYLKIRDLLTLDNYYKTDLHWRQETILPIASYLLDGMNNHAEQYSYTQMTLEGFSGVYRGQSALPIAKETMIYLTASEQLSVTVKDLETGKTLSLYNEDDFKSTDPYTLFLGGPKSLLKLENRALHNGKTLYLFRDSFGSSLAPLLLSGYETIYLIDLRYVDSRYLDLFLTFEEGADVLFLYSTHVLNESNLLR